MLAHETKESEHSPVMGMPSHDSELADDSMLRALAAEDQPLVLELLVAELTDAGFAVTEVSNAARALAVLERDSSFDLLFTDIKMPGDIDGWELGRRARTLIPELRIIYATAYVDDVPTLSERERHLMKPYRTVDLRATLSSLQFPWRPVSR